MDISSLGLVNRLNENSSIECEVCHRKKVPMFKSDVSGKAVCIPCITDIIIKFMSKREKEDVKTKKRKK